MNVMDALIRDISELVQIPTVYDAASVTPKMPYGKQVYQGYLWIRDKALQDGFEVLEFDGHALAIRIKGSSQGRIDIASHVDVVEPGEGWDMDPFCGLITKEYIYGRGTVDMKGTLLLTYYALKYTREQQLPCKRELRLVIGCDEERTMQDMQYYISKAGAPDFAFTPDGKFPYSLGEKGALMWTLDGEMDTCIEELLGGVQCNVVSPIAKARIKGSGLFGQYETLIKKKGFAAEVRNEESSLTITVHGKAAHASVPEEGLSATVQLLELIQEVSKDPLAGLLYRCFQDANGRGGNMAYDIPPMGKLTLNLGVLEIKDRKLTAQIDCRYPKGITSESLTEKLKLALSPLDVTLSYDAPPSLADTDSPFLATLLESYREVSMDRKEQPFISGGVTYSKVIPNCVAFGPMRHGDILLAHQANERLEISRIQELYEIYKETMIRLAGMDERLY